jgi:hypothetical protein
MYQIKKCIERLERQRSKAMQCGNFKLYARLCFDINDMLEVLESMKLKLVGG